MTVPVEFTDPINTKILAVSEDQVQGFQRDPLGEISRLSGVETPVVIERIQAMMRAGNIRRVRQTLLATNLAQGALVAWHTESLDATPRVLLDPNKLSTDGTVALGGYSISEDGNFIAYGTSASGSDWQEWHVRDVRTGADRDDLLKWVKFSGASWLKDGSGFFYSRYDEPKPGEQLKGANYFQKLFFHKLGTPQSDDRLVYERPDQKDWGFGGSVTEDGHYLIISVWRGKIGRASCRERV